MNKTYVIRWRSKVNGRIGTGSRVFEKEAASNLAAELNADYPEIEHEVTEYGGEAPTPDPGVETKEGEQPTESHALSA